MSSSDSKFVSYGHIHPNNLKRFSMGQGISVSKGEWENTDHPFVRVSYSARKHQTRHARNHSRGTKTLLKQSDLADIGVQQHQGSGFFSSLKKVFDNPVVKGITKVAAPILIDAGKKGLSGLVTKMSGNSELGDAVSGAAGDLAQKGVDSYTGSGMRRRGGGGKKGAGFLDDIGSLFGGGLHHKGGSMAPLGGRVGGGMHAKVTQNAVASKAAVNAIQDRQNGVAVNQSPGYDFKNSPQFDWNHIPSRMAYLRSKRKGRSTPAQDKLL
jgi:hypothetical protein